MEIVAFTVGIVGLVFGVYCGWRVWNWERILSGSRVAIAFKGKVKMDPTLLDILRWARVLSKDKQNRGGQVFYKMGGTTVAVLKPRRLTGRTKTRTKENK